MFRRPPRSTLFPTRRSSDLCVGAATGPLGDWIEAAALASEITALDAGVLSLHPPSATSAARKGNRSEEHTSELQSQFHLVCRLLLEKKKKKTALIYNQHKII